MYIYIYVYILCTFIIYIYEPTNEQTQVFGGCYLKGSEPIKNLVYHSKKKESYVEAAKIRWKQ